MQNFRSSESKSRVSRGSSFRKNRRSDQRSGGFNQSRSFSGKPSSRRPKKRFGAETIDIRKFVKKATPVAKIQPNIKNTFRDFGLCQKINENLANIGYTTPTPIQDGTIAQILAGRDLLGLANTGTGKTAAFLLPLIDKCYRNKEQNVLIIAPTRELAQQIEVEFRKFSRNMNLYSAVCVGGVPIFKQFSALARTPHFVIGTPGRLKDLKDRGRIRFNVFQNIVLDEIDRMLDMGFVDEIRTILSELPEKRQSLFFSATLPKKIETLIGQFLRNPITVKTTTGETAANVDQDIVRCTQENKFDKLTGMLSDKELKKVLIFSETKRDVEKLADNLNEVGFRADSIHGDKRQNQRQKALMRFKQDQIQVLVATDVAARGLDIADVSHVINYTIPNNFDDYIHRIGRTGRGGKTGVALTFVG